MPNNDNNLNSAFDNPFFDDNNNPILMNNDFPDDDNDGLMF